MEGVSGGAWLGPTGAMAPPTKKFSVYYHLIYKTFWGKFYIIPLISPLNYVEDIFSPLLILAEAPPLEGVSLVLRPLKNAVRVSRICSGSDPQVPQITVRV
jgi:hypothetical protein